MLKGDEKSLPNSSINADNFWSQYRIYTSSKTMSPLASLAKWRGKYISQIKNSLANMLHMVLVDYI